MKILFAGTPDFAVPALLRLIEDGHSIPLVITMPDRPKGRKKEPQPSPVKEAAAANGIALYQPEKMRPEDAQYLAAFEPDLIVVTAYGMLIPKEVLELPKYGCVNEHASLLPAYRGAAPIQRALLDGCAVTGVSIMQMNEGLDTGDILSVREVPIEKTDTSGSLFDKLAAAGADLLSETVRKLEEGGIRAVPQPKESTTPYARMIKKEDGRTDWSRGAEELERFVRGMDPWPGAFTVLNGKNLRIWKAAVSPENNTTEKPGCIVAAGKEGILVQTGNGVLSLLEIQMEGKKRMDAASFLRGFRLEIGTVLGG